MPEVIAAIATWCIAFIFIRIMHRIQPEDKLYKVLVIFNAFIVTIALVYSVVA